MKYLGIPLEKPKVGVFGFTGCEGCQLQIANKEETLGDLLGAIEIMNFRLISSDKLDDYDIAFVEGSITTEEEADRLRKIRQQVYTPGYRHDGEYEYQDGFFCTVALHVKFLLFMRDSGDRTYVPCGDFGHMSDVLLLVEN